MESLFKLSVIYSVVDKLSGPVRNIARAVTDLEKTMAKAQKSIEFGQRLGVSAALVQEAENRMSGVAMQFVEPFARVEDATVALGTITQSTMGGVEKSLAATTKAAIEWSKTHTDTAEQFIRTSYNMASAGLNDVQAIEATRTALTVAKATMGDATETAELIAIAFNNMGNKAADAATEMTRLGDVLTTTQQYFQFRNMGQLAEGLKYAIPSALQFKTSFEELNTVIGQLNNAGLTGSMAGTAFAATMRELTSASRELGFQLARTKDGGISLIGTIVNMKKRFGKDFGALSDDMKMAFQKSFGDEGIRAIALLWDKTDDLNEALEMVKNSSGAAARAQVAMEKSVASQWKITQNRLTAVKITLGEKLLPVINETLSRLITLADWMGKFVEQNPGLAKAAVYVLAIGGAALMVLAPVMSLIAAVVMSWGYILQGAAKIAEAYLKLKTIIGGSGLAALVKKVGDAFLNGFSAARLAALRAVTVISGYFRVLQARAIMAGAAIRALAISLVTFARQAILTAVRALPGLIASVWAFTLSLLANPITWVVVGLVALGAAIYYCAKNWDTIKAAVINAWEVTKTAVASGVAKVWEFIKSFALTLLQFTCPPLVIVMNWDKVVAAYNALLAWFAPAYDVIRQIVGTALEAPGIAWHAVKQSLNDALNWITGMFNTFRSSGAALWQAFTDGISSALSGPAEVVMEGLQRVRNLLPFSDAKEGPLSTLTKSGRALVSTIQEGVAMQMPRLKGSIAAGLSAISLAVPGPVVTGAPVLLGSTELPNITALTGHISYDTPQVAQPLIKLPKPTLTVASALQPPTIPRLTGHVLYQPVLKPPVAPDLAGRAFYQSILQPPEIPDTRDVISYSIAPVELPNLPGLLRVTTDLKNRESAGVNKKEIHIHGNVIIKVQKVDQPEDLWTALKRFAEEVGGE